MSQRERFRLWKKKDLLDAYAYWRAGMLESEDIPDIACEALNRGFDTETIRVAAGLNEPTNSDLGDCVDIQEFWQQIGLPLMDEQKAGECIALKYCAQVLSGETSPQEAADAMWDLYVALGYPQEAAWSKLGYLADEYYCVDGDADPVKKKIDQRIIDVAKELIRNAQG